MATATVNVDVTVDLDAFDDEELLAEVKLRGLLSDHEAQSSLLDMVRDNGNAKVIQVGICEPYVITIGGKSSSGAGRATIVILDGE